MYHKSFVLSLLVAFSCLGFPAYSATDKNDACVEVQNKMKEMNDMMVMHHAMMANKWLVTEKGIYILIGDRMQKLDNNLQIVRELSLSVLTGEGAVSSSQKLLMPDIKQTADALYVVWGPKLLKFDYELSLVKVQSLDAPSSAE